MNRGLEVPDLREIQLLRHLTEKELKNIKSIHLYASGRSIVEGLSAIYITHTDEVFLTGSDSLLGKSSTGKIAGLSGLSVQKIVVGAEFGAALTSSKELYMWGCDLGIPAGLSRLVIKNHVNGACCPQCSKSCVRVGTWSRCYNCRCESYYVFINKVSTIPHPADWRGPTTTCLGYAETDTQPQIPDTLFCIKCLVNSEWYFELISNFHILRCMTCRSLIREGNGIPSQTIPAPHKVQTTLKIEDIAAGMNYLLIRSSSQLIIWGDLNGNRCNHAVPKQRNVKFTKVACGSNHIAVITQEGDLYTCGVGDEGQLGYAWDEVYDGYIELKKVELAKPAMDVACGKTSTLCLLRDGTHVFYGNIGEVVQSGSTSLDLCDKAVIVVPSIVDYSVGDIVLLSLMHHVQPHGKRVPVLTGDLSDAYIVLHGLPQITTGAVGESCASAQRSDGSASDNANRSSNSAHLYGQLLLSDLTLKLADGDFPVHRFALYASSAHFSQLFADSEPPDVLDMLSFNASAYRGLLKYFYGVPLGPMSCEDLIDLYVLATSYKEDWISADVLSKLKTSIDTENVLVIHDRAKSENAPDLLAECQAFMNAPLFKQSLLDSLAQNHDIAELLRISLSTKS